MGRIIRVTEPSIAQYREASRVAAELWVETKILNRQERFAAFQEMGVELVLAEEGEKLQGVAFLLPDSYQGLTQEHRFYWLFRVYSRPVAKNLGAVMLMKIMQWYPALMGIGITPVAAKLYATLRWRQYPRVWRCVHPIRLTNMVARYADRLKGSWQASFFRVMARGYDLFSGGVESFINPALAAVRKTPAPLPAGMEPTPQAASDRKRDLVSTYLPLFRVSQGDRVLEAFGFLGAGRIVRDDFHGLARFRAHVKLWQELRKQQMSFSEFLSTSEEENRRAYWCGYVPFRMPIYYWDKKNDLPDYFLNLDRKNFTFTSCDKLL